MNHEQIKQMMLQDSEVKKEYDALAPIYEIQEELIKLRNEKGLNQKQLAELIGTKQSAISRLESGNYNPSIQLLTKLAEAFNKELHIVFK